MNHRKYLRRALTLTAPSIPFIMFAFAYMAFAIPADGLQTVLESLIAFTTLTVGVALFAAGWLVWLCALAGSAFETSGRESAHSIASTTAQDTMEPSHTIPQGKATSNMAKPLKVPRKVKWNSADHPRTATENSLPNPSCSAAGRH